MVKKPNPMSRCNYSGQQRFCMSIEDELTVEALKSVTADVRRMKAAERKEFAYKLLGDGKDPK